MEEEEDEEVWVEYNTSLYGFALHYWGGLQEGRQSTGVVRIENYTDEHCTSVGAARLPDCCHCLQGCCHCLPDGPFE